MKPFFVVLAVLLLLCACAPKTDPGPSAPANKMPGHARPYKVDGKWYKPIASADNFTQRGIASWYGRDFHGKRTSNGEIYDMYAMSAAHKTLPMGTWVRVRHLRNNKEIDLRINDRGPFVRGRIIDLSYTAAKAIGIVKDGTGPVEVSVLGRGKDALPAGDEPATYNAGTFSFQVGAFKNRQNAERLKRQLENLYEHVYISAYDTGDGTLYRVRVGRYASLEEIEAAEHTLVQSGLKGAFIVAE